MDKPPLPLGLEYHEVHKSVICNKCANLLLPGQFLIRRSKYKQLLVTKYFPSVKGYCLECSKDIFADLAASIFSEAQKTATLFHQLSEATTKTEEEAKNKDFDLDILEMSIEHFNNVIDELGKYLESCKDMHTEFVNYESD